MTITNEMIEAAQLLREAAAVLTEVEAAGLDVKAVKNWRWPLLDELLGAAGILEASESLRPKMVEVGFIRYSPKHGFWKEINAEAHGDLGCGWVDCKLYAEQPK